MATAGGCSGSSDVLYKDPHQPVEIRVQDLLSRMTLQEKVAQMAQIERAVVSPTALTELSIGSVLSSGGSAPQPCASALHWADMVDAMQRCALSSRLGIPIIYSTDAVHGHNNLLHATIFPHNVGLGATRDGELARRIGVATALEVRATGIHCTFAPCVANVIACAKHFVGDGGTHRGINEGNTNCSFEELEKIHIMPYRDCLDQGVCTIMASYSSWNDRALHSDRYLLTDILKGKLGFKGFLISDWEGIDRLTWPHGSNYRYCISASVNAGIDMEHLELAREAVRKSLVLLKNGKDPNKPFLPLDKNARRILVSGQHADDIGYQCGGWTITWYGGSGRTTAGTSILDAIKEAVGEKTEVIYEQHPSEDTFANKEFSFAIVIVGEVAYAEILGDRSQLNIPLGGAELISRVASKVPTVVIVISGRPLVFKPDLMDKIDALVAAWLPGTEGSGVADVLFGDYDFEGLLPVTWFKSVSQLPMNADHPSYDPHFPIGFGLKMGLNCS
ncbi:hypothetical protein KFK09_010370 [Dendrobium nobile]|uniref:Beta-glucosidase n=1 Tax=Dendrobium nobile TaxID=94219 RepID=A0A8T3BBJ1_DENNO|nr:hypothetical protein KFK09_010370 [Dendrobium nobile]